jgi:hypothetical protein
MKRGLNILEADTEKFAVALSDLLTIELHEERKKHPCMKRGRNILEADTKRLVVAVEDVLTMELHEERRKQR